MSEQQPAPAQEPCAVCERTDRPMEPDTNVCRSCWESAGPAQEPKQDDEDAAWAEWVRQGKNRPAPVATPPVLDVGDILLRFRSGELDFNEAYDALTAAVSPQPAADLRALVAKIIQRWRDTSAPYVATDPAMLTLSRCASDLEAALAAAPQPAEQCTLEEGCSCPACERERKWTQDGKLRLNRYGRQCYEAGRKAAVSPQPAADLRALIQQVFLTGWAERGKLAAFGPVQGQPLGPIEEAWERCKGPIFAALASAPQPAEGRTPECPCNCHSPVLAQNDGMACEHCAPEGASHE